MARRGFAELGRTDLTEALGCPQNKAHRHDDTIAASMETPDDSVTAGSEVSDVIEFVALTF
jgi:hypothetical protein